MSAVYAACVWKQMLNIIHFGRGVKALEIILLIPERLCCCYLVLSYTLPGSWHIVHASKLDLPLHLGRVLVVARAKVCGFLLAPSPVPAWHSHLLLAPFMPLLGDLRLRGLCAILSCLCWAAISACRSSGAFPLHLHSCCRLHNLLLTPFLHAHELHGTLPFWALLACMLIDRWPSTCALSDGKSLAALRTACSWTRRMRFGDRGLDEGVGLRLRRLGLGGCVKSLAVASFRSRCLDRGVTSGSKVGTKRRNS
jgi:hypothetical protein